MVRIICKGLYKTYDKAGTKALKNVNLDIDAKGILTLIGRNGAGKTTFIRILSTQLKPTRGKVILDGVDVVSQPEKIRNKIAVIPQDSSLVPWMTAKQNILVYLLWRGFKYKDAVKRAESALDTMGIREYADKLPRKLSGGTRRKVMVATVLSSEAEIIFLDEPTTGLDPVSRRELWNILNKMKEDKLIILTTHYLEEAEELSDDIAVLDRGRLLRVGSINQLRKSIGYPYAVRIFDGGLKIPGIRGKVVKKDKDTLQIFCTEKEADRIADRLIRSKARFSINPTSLEDIFYMLIGDIKEDIHEKEQA